MKTKEKIRDILMSVGTAEEKAAAIAAMLPSFLREDCASGHSEYPVGAGTRQLTSHDRSETCPTKGELYGIIAIDQWGVEHTSKQSDIPHPLWSWEEIVLWRYDDPTIIEMMSNRIAVLHDSLDKAT